MSSPRRDAAARAPGVPRRRGRSPRAPRAGITARIVGGVRVAVALVYRTGQMYGADHCGTYAAAIAYYTLFSLIPLTLVVVSGINLIVVDRFIEQQDVVDFIFDQIPLRETASVRRNVEDAVTSAQDTSPSGLLFGLGILVWTASGIFGAVRRGLNATTHRRGHPYLRGKLIDIALIVALGLLIVLSLGLTAAVSIAFQRAGNLGLVDIQTSWFVRVGVLAAPALVSFVMFVVLYRFVPTAQPRWPDAIAGALFATILFEAAKNAVAFAVPRAPYVQYSALYAGLGTALAILFWTFIAASILLLGAEFSRAVGLWRHGVDEDPGLDDSAFTA